MMEFRRFAGAFKKELAPDFPEPMEPSTTLFEDLALDSFAAFRMILFLEELADVPFPPDDIPPMFVVGDAYDYYTMLCSFGGD